MSQPKSYYTPPPAITEAELGDGSTYKQLLNLIPHHVKTVLDVGCGNGLMAMLLAQRGCTVTGIERFAEAAHIAQRYCNQVLIADLDATPLHTLMDRQAFDLILFADVLEHLRDPWQLLKDSVQLLAPQGIVVASIPNIAHGNVRLALLQGRFDYTPMGLLDDTHLRFFTRHSVLQLFKQAHFSIQALQTIDAPVFTQSPILPPVTPQHFPTSLVESIQHAPDATVIQFIVKATPDTLHTL